MRAIKLALSLFIFFELASCATYQSSATKSDHAKGYAAAWEYAKQDAIKDMCFRNPRYTYWQVRKKYKQLLEDQGRSETYISGFYYGYESSYHDFYDLYCGDIYYFKE
jgi:hypothetical protein